MINLAVRDVMTRDVIYLPAETRLDEAAQAMRDADIGDVVVTEGGTLVGLVTDRDIVVRAVAERADPAHTTIGSVATREIMMIEQYLPVAEAAQLMRERSVRRILVCDAERRLVGIVSLGDLAMRLDLTPAAPGSGTSSDTPSPVAH